MNFELQPEDTAYLAELVVKARKKAKNAPGMVTASAMADFSHRFGPWNLSLTIEHPVGKPRSWHASVAALDEIGTKPVQLPSGIIAQAPEEALVATEHWDKDISEAADFLLGELLGPEIKHRDQQVNVFNGLWARHWVTTCES